MILRLITISALCLVTAGPFAGAADNSWSRHLAASVEGEGPPVILLAGLSCSEKIWSKTVAVLRKNHTCHLLSVRGFGGTPRDPGSPVPTIKILRDAILSYLDDHALERPIFVGHSLGGSLGLWLAQARPELLGGLVVVDALPNFPWDKMGDDPESLRDATLKILEKGPGERFKEHQRLAILLMLSQQNLREEVWAMVDQSDPPSVLSVLSGLMQTDLSGALKSIRCSLLVVVGLADKARFLGVGEVRKQFQEAYQPVPQTEIVFFEKAGHFVMLEEPGRFAALLEGELRKFSARSLPLVE